MKTTCDELAADLSDADRRKNEFLATLAHELRNPLAPMSNMLEVVKRADGDGEVLKRAHETLERQLAQMVRLVDDLLDLNRVTHDRLELRRSEVELSSVIQQAVEVARPLVDAAGHHLTSILPEEPIYLNADRARLAQVFGNLLNNSCKYTRAERNDFAECEASWRRGVGDGERQRRRNSAGQDRQYFRHVHAGRSQFGAIAGRARVLD